MLMQVYVNGMYAFVLYDSAQDLYMAARDPVGRNFTTILALRIFLIF